MPRRRSRSSSRRRRSREKAKERGRKRRRSSSSRRSVEELTPEMLEAQRKQKALEEKLIEEEVWRRYEAELQSALDQRLASTEFREMVKVKVDQERTRLEEVMLREVEEAKQAILEDVTRKQKEEEEKERAEEELRKKEAEKEQAVKQKQLEAQAKLDEQRLKDLEQRQEEQRKRRDAKVAEEAKKVAETSRLLNTQGQRQSVGFKLKQNII
ncbi:unnamed protein product [Effrenium voratum]|nr:unnamed protein product [Effrenium voratum]CAJ1426622.1 unnamed protein product [Effrenium voratum]